MSEPTWMKRPTGPGIWMCQSIFPGDDEPRFTVVTMTEERLAAGAPFYSEQVFGPIPEPPIDLPY